MARDDIAGAEILAEKLEERASLSWEVGFHAQQAVEKFLKAVLVSVGVIPSRTHDIAYLVDESLQYCPALAPFSEELSWLTQFASEARYPGGFDISPEKALEVLGKAKKVGEVIERWFMEREEKDFTVALDGLPEDEITDDVERKAEEARKYREDPDSFLRL